MTTKPRRRASAVILLAALLVLPSCLSAARAQERTASGDRERGIALYQKGDLAGAVEALSAAVKKEKQDADAWHFLGLAYYSQGDAKGARKAFQTEAKLRPDSATAHVGTAYAFLLDGKLSQAATEAERALALDAKNTDAHYILGVKYFGEGAATKALGEAAEALRLSPNFAPAHLLKAQVLLGSSEWVIVYLPGETDEERDERILAARASLETYLKLYPQTPGRALMQETLESLKSAYKLRAAPPGAAPPPGQQHRGHPEGAHSLQARAAVHGDGESDGRQRHGRHTVRPRLGRPRQKHSRHQPAALRPDRRSRQGGAADQISAGGQGRPPRLPVHPDGI
jgi:tetratricopeptide (TPR) repeat protein